MDVDFLSVATPPVLPLAACDALLNLCQYSRITLWPKAFRSVKSV